jgi:hypothetical protein
MRLQILLMPSAQSDERYERAATRWLARFALERPGAGLEGVRLGLLALEALPSSPDDGKDLLRHLCHRHRVDPVAHMLA